MLLGLASLLLMLAGSSMLVHSHGGVNAHVHILGRVHTEPAPAMHGQAHLQAEAPAHQDSHPTFAQADNEHFSMLIVWPACTASRTAFDHTALGHLSFPRPAPEVGIDVPITLPQALQRGPPDPIRPGCSGTQRVLQTTHALLI